MIEDFDLPKLKKDKINFVSIESKNVSDSSLNKGEKYKSNTRVIVYIILIALFILLTLIFILSKGKVKEIIFNDVHISSLNVVSYDKDKNIINLEIEPSNEQQYCAVKVNDDLDYQFLINGKCYITVPLDKQTIYFVNKYDVVSNELFVDNYVFNIDLKDKYYIPLNSKIDLNHYSILGSSNIEWISSSDNVMIENDILIGNSVGTTTIDMVANDDVLKSFEVVVTDVIIEMPNEFNDKKAFLSCRQFTEEEAALLDEILAYRIAEAGEGTRAGAVAAARFLTLEFPYRISYFWETGRLNNSGKHYVDGEGRYYHKGLYLDQSKVDSMEASFHGPAMWGCPIVSYEEDPPNFEPGRKYPNGLDCSGFVSWSLLNGGSGLGDIGSYMLPYRGDYRTLSTSLINSGIIKVGDLFSLSGHVGILIGDDGSNFYIAESLNNYKGLVVKKYSYKKVMNYFTAVTLMDKVYQGDGNLTKMWY